MRKTSIYILLFWAMTGCVSQEEINAKRNQYLATIPECRSESSCKSMWEAAQVWVARNAGYKVQVSTDTVIETFNSIGSSTGIAVSVLKVPLGDGHYKIEVNIRCANIFGCTPNAWVAAQNFNNTLNAFSET